MCDARSIGRPVKSYRCVIPAVLLLRRSEIVAERTIGNVIKALDLVTETECLNPQLDTYAGVVGRSPSYVD